MFDLFCFQSLLANSAVQTASAIHTSVQRIVTEASQAREAGVDDWQVAPKLPEWPINITLVAIRWRPLEGAFAVLGSQAEVILDISNDEHDAGRPRPIDIDYLLAHVIPPLLTLSGA